MTTQTEIATEQFEVRNRWTNAVQTRKPTPRSARTVRARISHTSAQKRRLDIFVTEPVCRDAEWTANGTVRAQFSRDNTGFYVRVFPSHSGVKASPTSRKSKTLRIAISGAPIVNGLCAKVREVPFVIEGSIITVSLPLDWAALADMKQRAEAEASA